MWVGEKEMGGILGVPRRCGCLNEEGCGVYVRVCVRVEEGAGVYEKEE